jgi:hypothetical protein
MPYREPCRVAAGCFRLSRLQASVTPHAPHGVVWIAEVEPAVRSSAHEGEIGLKLDGVHPGRGLGLHRVPVAERCAGHGDQAGRVDARPVVAERHLDEHQAQHHGQVGMPLTAAALRIAANEERSRRVGEQVDRRPGGGSERRCGLMGLQIVCVPYHLP